MKRHLAIILLVVLASLIVVSPVLALGIGLGCGFKFELGSIHKGQSYHIGQMCILNTNPELTCFKMDVGYFYQQPELQAPKDWVRFEPETFCLEANKVQASQIYLKIPNNAKKGDYFALLTGCTDTGGYVGVCVGTKLMFTVEPKGWWQRWQ